MLVAVSAVLAGLAGALVAGRPARLGCGAPAGARRSRTTRQRLGGKGLARAAGLGAACAVLLVLPGPLGWAAAALTGLVVQRLVARLEPAAARRRRERLEEAVPLVVDLMAASLRVGAPPAGALNRVRAAVEDPMAAELAPWCARLALGADPVAVWAALSRHPQLGPLGRALHRAAESGASVADALTRLAEETRARRRAAAEALARTVEVRAAVPLGLCLLPAFVLVGVVPLVAGSVAGFLGS